MFLRSIWYQLQLLRNLRTTFVLLSVFPRKSPFFKLSFIFSFSFLSNHTIYCIHILFTTLSLILISPGHLNYELCTTYAALWILAFTFCQQVQLDLNSIKSILASASKLEGSSIMKCKVGGSLWKVPVVLLRSDTQHINTNIWVTGLQHQSNYNLFIIWQDVQWMTLLGASLNYSENFNLLEAPLEISRGNWKWSAIQYWRLLFSS